jgi:error-prone DNA polymerase
MSYAELHCKTNFSFLTGASHADELVDRAIEMDYAALAITDENSLAGVVRAFGAARHTKLKLIIGAEIILNDAPPMLLWATDRKSYGRLSHLITVGRRRAPKGQCWLSLDDVLAVEKDLLAGLLPSFNGDRNRAQFILDDPTHASHDWFAGASAYENEVEKMNRVRAVFGDRAYLMAALYKGVDDHWRLQQIQSLVKQTGLPPVASGDILYHCRSRMLLHDALTAVKYKTTIADAADRLLPNAQRHLQTVSHRRQSFELLPGALERTMEVADRCRFYLSTLRYEYPEGLSPEGETETSYLRRLTEAGIKTHYPQGTPEKVRRQIEHELALIKELNYEAYFLTVWDLVRFARQRGILCQGRGSAANSAVCYCLGITAVDPMSTDLLFERFISRERNEVPDIDVDFEHQRREEVLQYLYEKYGRDRAGIAATVVTYRSRSAIRDMGKALGLSLDRVGALTKQIEHFSQDHKLETRLPEAGMDPQSDTGRRLIFLVNELVGFPRHLSQHVGGMVMTRGRLDELVPIENASMADRTVIQWDKNDLEELGLLKVDCLCLGMLTAIQKCFDLIRLHWDRNLTLANLPQEDPLVYDMICEADTVGVFQIESRAQMTMLPRLRPRCWYDLVIEVSLVRPGPIQGDMVHPYLRRRSGVEPVEYPNDAIKEVLKRTLGVPIFQEQAMKLAVVAAGFTPGEADQLRRAMGAWRKTGTIEFFQKKLFAGMKQRGLSEKFADQVFRQIAGFGAYGFPESHAASFALLVYVSCYLKFYYPEAFCAALINSQPMGFYQPAQLVADAQRHDVPVLGVDVNFSHWDCVLEPEAEQSCEPQGTSRRFPSGNQPTASAQSLTAKAPSKRIPLRLGMRMVRGLREPEAQTVIEARRAGPFESVADFARRTRLTQFVMQQLSDADAFKSVKQDRREALWQSLGQEKTPLDQPLFGDLDVDDDDTLALPKLTPQEQVIEDYSSVGLSLRAHPISFHRDQLDASRVTRCGDLANHPNDRYVHVAGLVIMKQRPGTAKGITFVTLEDETGVANLVIKPPIWEKHYRIARQSSAWLVHGKLEIRERVVHVLVNRIESLSEKVAEVKLRRREFH